MNWKRILGMLVLLCVALFVFLACSLSSVPLISQVQPTATKRATRTPRPTFTPRPAPTETVEPEPVAQIEPTVEPTEAPPPTEPPAPTKRPTQRPQPRPTQPPPPTQPPAPPPTEPPKFPYKASIVTCTHAGNAYIKGSVCNDRNCHSKLSGIRVVLSDAPYGTIYDRVKTDALGDYTFTLSGNGPRPGTFYVWVVNNNDQPLSDVGGPIQLDMGHNQDDLINKCPNTSAFVSFFKP